MIPIPRTIPREYLARYLVRGVMYWVLLHLALVMLAGDLTFSPSSACAIGIAIGMLAYSEVLLRRESIFMRNLGVWPGWLLLIPGSIGLALDLALWIGMRAAA